MSNLVPFLWYSSEAEEAARFYAALLPDSHIDHVTATPAESPSGPAGSVNVVEFTLCGQPMMAMSAGPLDVFNHSISFMVLCDTQEEIDRYWTALSEGGEVRGLRVGPRPVKKVHGESRRGRCSRGCGTRTRRRRGESLKRC